jgi:heat shock protein HtpX
MRFLQIAKRVTLLLIVNILVMLTLAIIVSLIFGSRASRFGYDNLLAICFIFGMGGAFTSLALSRWMAKAMMGVEVIDPNSANQEEQRLVQTVYHLARAAGLSTMPEVGIYESPEINAFATGPSRSRALVAVSSGLLGSMRPSDIEGVLGHEITHVVNGDMVTMTLIHPGARAGHGTVPRFLAR